MTAMAKAPVLHQLQPENAAAVESTVACCWWINVIDPDLHTITGLHIDGRPDLETLAWAGARLTLGADLLVALRDEQCIPLSTDTLEVLRICVKDCEESVAQYEQGENTHPDDEALARARLVRLRGVTQTVERLLAEDDCESHRGIDEMPVEAAAATALAVPVASWREKAILASAIGRCVSFEIGPVEVGSTFEHLLGPEATNRRLDAAKDPLRALPEVGVVVGLLDALRDLTPGPDAELQIPAGYDLAAALDEEIDDLASLDVESLCSHVVHPGRRVMAEALIVAMDLRDLIGGAS